MTVKTKSRTHRRTLPGVELARSASPVLQRRDRHQSLRLTADPTIGSLRVTRFGKPSGYTRLTVERGVYLSWSSGQSGAFCLIDRSGRAIAEISGVPLQTQETRAPRIDLWPEMRRAFTDILLAAEPEDTEPLLYRGWIPYPALAEWLKAAPVGYNSSFEIADAWSERITKAVAYTTDGTIEMEIGTNSLPEESRRFYLALQCAGERASIEFSAAHAHAFEALVHHVFALARTEGTLPGFERQVSPAGNPG
jgi:hypothetical protein